MEIMIVGTADPEMDRHISNFFSKTEKKIESIKLRHLNRSNSLSMTIFF